MAPSRGSAWLKSEDALALFANGTPSKLNQELARGVDPNQMLEIPQLDALVHPRCAVRSLWPPVPEADKAACRALQATLLLPTPHLTTTPNPTTTPIAASTAPPTSHATPTSGSIAGDASGPPLADRWLWDPSWADSVMTQPAEAAAAAAAAKAAGKGPHAAVVASAAATATAARDVPRDARWPLVLVAGLLGHSPVLMERLLKAGADPNATHGRTGLTLLMCLVLNDRMGVGPKKEAMQMLQKHGFNRWGAVRRDSCLDAVILTILDLVSAQQTARQAMLTSSASTSVGGSGAVRQQPQGAGGGRGGGSGGGGAGRGAGRGGGDAATAMETCRRATAEGLEVLDELLRRRCWPPSRGAPFYLSSPLHQQLAAALMLLDAASCGRVLGAMSGKYGSSTGLGPCSRGLYDLIKMLCSHMEKQAVEGAGAAIQLATRNAVPKRLVAAGLSLEDPAVLGKRPLLEPIMLFDPAVLGAALSAGMRHDVVMLYRGVGPQKCQAWSTLLAEVVAEKYPPAFLEAVLRAGADPRTPVMGSVRPLTLAVMSENEAAQQALVRAGALPSDGFTPGPQPTLPEVQMRLQNLLSIHPADTVGPVVREALPWLIYLTHDGILNLVPLLASPLPDNRHTLLALLRVRLSCALTGALADAGAAEVGSDNVAWRPKLLSCHVDGPSLRRLAEHLVQQPANLYTPYLLTIFPFAIHQLMSEPKHARSCVAVFKALVKRLDPHTAQPTQTVTSPHPSPSSTTTTTATSSSSNNATPISSSGGPSVWLPARPPGYAWPAPTELPTEVLSAAVRLPETLCVMAQHWGQGVWTKVSSLFWRGGLPSDALRIASTILRENYLSPATPSSPSSSSSSPSSSSPSSPSPPPPSPALLTRWRLLSTIFGCTLPALGPGHTSPYPSFQISCPTPNASRLPLTLWLADLMLLLHADPWVRALVSNDTIDAIARATNEAAAAAARTTCKTTDVLATVTAVVEAGGVEAPKDKTDEGAVQMEADDGEVVGQAGRPEWEVRLAAAVEAVATEAVASMSQQYSCPLSSWVADRWVAQQTEAKLAARRSAAAAATSTTTTAAVAGSGKAAGKAAANNAVEGVGAAATTPSYGPYDACLAGVPYWVQAAVEELNWAVLVGLHESVRVGAGGAELARGLMAAQARMELGSGGGAGGW